MTKQDKTRPGRQVMASRRKTALLPRLLTRHEVVALSGISYPTLWQYMRQGKFPLGRVVGGRTYWDAAEFEAWLSALPRQNLKPIDDDPKAA